MQIIKRDGKVEAFVKSKISIAIQKAMKFGVNEVDEIIADKIADMIETDFSKEETDKNDITIYKVEKLIFLYLIKLGLPLVAREYESYKTIRSYERECVNTTDNAILDLIDYKNTEVMRENSNKDAVLNSTQRDLIAGEVSKDIARRKLLPPRVIKAHDEGQIHFHDLDYAIQPMFNCCLINIADMLDNGTVINEKMIDTPNSFQVACTVTTQVIAQVASAQYGFFR